MRSSRSSAAERLIGGDGRGAMQSSARDTGPKRRQLTCNYTVGVSRVAAIVGREPLTSS